MRLEPQCPGRTSCRWRGAGAASKRHRPIDRGGKAPSISSTRKPLGRNSPGVPPHRRHLAVAAVGSWPCPSTTALLLMQALKLGDVGWQGGVAGAQQDVVTYGQASRSRGDGARVRQLSRVALRRACFGGAAAPAHPGYTARLQQQSRQRRSCHPPGVWAAPARPRSAALLTQRQRYGRAALPLLPPWPPTDRPRLLLSGARTLGQATSQKPHAAQVSATRAAAPPSF